MAALVEGKHASEALISEAENFHCRDEVVIAESQTIVACAVLGQVGPNEGAVTVGAPVNTGTGNGVCTVVAGAGGYSAAVMEGSYRINIVSAVAAGGEFIVTRPDGTVDGNGKIGTAYTGQINFTVADGSNDFVAGDYITVPVTIAEAAAASQWKAHDPDATDGAQIAAGVAIYPATTGAGETKAIAAWTRGPCQLRASDIAWPHVGITAGEKAAAIAQLAEKGIILR